MVMGEIEGWQGFGLALASIEVEAMEFEVLAWVGQP